jgi:hypothetical protein
MMQNFEVSGKKWASMGAQLHAAVAETRTAIASIPEDVELGEEFELVDSASASACQIAQAIMALNAVTPRQKEVMEMAAAWLDGTYPQ